MFCQYCGKPNPDDASFCGACGKNITWKDQPAPRAATTPEPVHVVSEAEERLVRSILAPEQQPPPQQKKKKDRWDLPNWVGVLAGIGIILMVLPHKDGSSVCDAAHNEV